jgi:hypothetical protein
MGRRPHGVRDMQAVNMGLVIIASNAQDTDERAMEEVRWDSVLHRMITLLSHINFVQRP